MLLRNPPQPPFRKGGQEEIFSFYQKNKIFEITSKNPPFVKGDKGGLLNSLFSFQQSFLQILQQLII